MTEVTSGFDKVSTCGIPIRTRISSSKSASASVVSFIRMRSNKRTRTLSTASSSIISSPLNQTNGMCAMTNAHSKDTLDAMSSTLMGIFQMRTEKRRIRWQYACGILKTHQKSCGVKMHTQTEPLCLRSGRGRKLTMRLTTRRYAMANSTDLPPFTVLLQMAIFFQKRVTAKIRIWHLVVGAIPRV